MEDTATEKARMVRSFPIWKETDEKTNKPVLRIDQIEANPKDTIRWEADTTHAISIWFPDTGVFVTPVIAVMHEGPVEATIRDKVEGGVQVGKTLEYEYAIYDHTEHKFVTCQSHPKIVIPKP